MAELVVIFDPVKEMAAIINTDDRIGWGPTMIGPQAGDFLQTFIDGLPFDISQVSSYDARGFYESWFQRIAGDILEDAEPSASGPVDVAGDDSVVEAARAAFEAAQAAGAPPSPAPADADMEADAGAAVAVSAPLDAPPTPVYDPGLGGGGQRIDCPGCGKTGKNPAGIVNGSDVCPMCNGDKYIVLGGA